MPQAVEALSRRSTSFASSSSPAKPSMPSAKQRLVIVLPPVLTVPSLPSKALRLGESRHPYRTPTVVWNQSPMLPLKWTALVALS